MLKQFLIIHKEFFKVAQKFFNNDENLITSVNKTCGNFINNNAIAEAANNARKSAKLLTRSCDIFLRKGFVSRWIDEELHRVQAYLHSSASASLIKKLEQIFILDYNLKQSILKQK
ncbi:unnamed protein product, partial [Rotaria sp. Silwood1]